MNTGTPAPNGWTAETIPAELTAIHDAPGGTSLRGLAQILNAYDEWRDDAACALAEEALAADGYDADEQRETVAALMPPQMDAIAAREDAALAAPGTSIAPWTDAEVESLNGYQASAAMHPFTCGNDDEPCNSVLLATANGWQCPDCDYTQNWATSWMANWAWRVALETGIGAWVPGCVAYDPHADRLTRSGSAETKPVAMVDFPAGTSDEHVAKFKRAWTGGPLKIRRAGEDDDD